MPSRNSQKTTSIETSSHGDLINDVLRNTENEKKKLTLALQPEQKIKGLEIACDQLWDDQKVDGEIQISAAEISLKELEYSAVSNLIPYKLRSKIKKARAKRTFLQSARNRLKTLNVNWKGKNWIQINKKGEVEVDVKDHLLEAKFRNEALPQYKGKDLLAILTINKDWLQKGTVVRKRINLEKLKTNTGNFDQIKQSIENLGKEQNISQLSSITSVENTLNQWIKKQTKHSLQETLKDENVIKLQNQIESAKSKAKLFEKAQDKIQQWKSEGIEIEWEDPKALIFKDGKIYANKNWGGKILLLDVGETASIRADDAFEILQGNLKLLEKNDFSEGHTQKEGLSETKFELREFEISQIIHNFERYGPLDYETELEQWKEKESAWNDSIWKNPESRGEKVILPIGRVLNTTIQKIVNTISPTADRPRESAIRKKDAMAKKLKKIEKHIEANSKNPRKNESLEKLKEIYQVELQGFIEATASIDSTTQATEFRDAQLTAEFTPELIKSFGSFDQAFEYAVKSLKTMDEDNWWQSKSIKESYSQFASSLFNALGSKAQKPEERVELAKLMTGRGYSIDNNVKNPTLAADQLDIALDRDGLVMALDHKELNHFEPIVEKIKSQQQKLEAETQSLTAEQKKLLGTIKTEALTAPYNFDHLATQFAIAEGGLITIHNLKNPKAPKPITSAAIQAEFETLAIPAIEKGHLALEQYLHQGLNGKSTEQVESDLGLDGYFNETRAEAFELLKDIEGMGILNVKDSFASSALQISKIGLTIIAAIAVGIATLGTGSPIAAGIIAAGAKIGVGATASLVMAGGAGMTTASALINQEGVESLGEFLKVYGTNLTVDSATMGIGRYAASAGSVIKILRGGGSDTVRAMVNMTDDAFTQRQAVWKAINTGAKADGMAAILSVDDAFRAGVRLQGVGAEILADQLLATPLETARMTILEGGSVLKNLKKVVTDPMTWALMGGLGIGFDVGPAFWRQVAGTSPSNLTQLADQTRKIQHLKTQLLKKPEFVGLGGAVLYKAIKNSNDPEAKELEITYAELGDKFAIITKDFDSINPALFRKRRPPNNNFDYTLDNPPSKEVLENKLKAQDQLLREKLTDSELSRILNLIKKEDLDCGLRKTIQTLKNNGQDKRVLKIINDPEIRTYLKKHDKLIFPDRDIISIQDLNQNLKVKVTIKPPVEIVIPPTSLDEILSSFKYKKKLQSISAVDNEIARLQHISDTTTEDGHNQKMMLIGIDERLVGLKKYKNQVIEKIEATYDLPETERWISFKKDIQKNLKLEIELNSKEVKILNQTHEVIGGKENLREKIRICKRHYEELKIKEPKKAEIWKQTYKYALTWGYCGRAISNTTETGSTAAQSISTKPSENSKDLLLDLDLSNPNILEELNLEQLTAQSVAYRKQKVKFNTALEETQKASDPITALKSLMEHPDFKPENLNSEQSATVFRIFRNNDAWDESIKVYHQSTSETFHQSIRIRELLASSYLKKAEAINKKLIILKKEIQSLTTSSDLKQKKIKESEYQGQLKDFEQQTTDANKFIVELIQENGASAETAALYAKKHELRALSSLSKEETLTHTNEAIKILETAFQRTYNYYPGIKLIYNKIDRGELLKNPEDIQEALKLAPTVLTTTLKEGGRYSGDIWTLGTMMEATLLSGKKDPGLEDMYLKSGTISWQYGTTYNKLVQAHKNLTSMKSELGDVENIDSIIEGLERFIPKIKQRIIDLENKNVEYIPSHKSTNTGDYKKAETLYQHGLLFGSLDSFIGGNIQYGGGLHKSRVNQLDREIGEIVLEKLDLAKSDSWDNLNEKIDHFIRYRFNTRKLEKIDGNPHKDFDDTISGFIKVFGINKEHDSGTNLMVDFMLGNCDCRQHASVKQLFFDIWKNNKINQSLKNGESKAVEELAQTQMVILNTVVEAPIKMKAKYKPRKTLKGREVIKTDDGTMRAVEDHTLNAIIKTDKDGKLVKFYLADSFYQNEFKFSGSENGLKEIPLSDIVIEQIKSEKEVDGKVVEYMKDKYRIKADKIQAMTKEKNSKGVRIRETVPVELVPASYSGNRDDLLVEELSDLGITKVRGIPLKPSGLNQQNFSDIITNPESYTQFDKLSKKILEKGRSGEHISFQGLSKHNHQIYKQKENTELGESIKEVIKLAYERGKIVLEVYGQKITVTPKYDTNWDPIQPQIVITEKNKIKHIKNTSDQDEIISKLQPS